MRESRSRSGRRTAASMAARMRRVGLLFCTLHAAALWGAFLALLHLYLQTETARSAVTTDHHSPMGIHFCDRMLLPEGLLSPFFHVGSDGTISSLQHGSSLEAQVFTGCCYLVG